MNAIEEKNKDTKKMILLAANELFAQKNFSGTSVRDIAQLAGVNLAAINYHFKNKENLYWEVFDYNHTWMTEEIDKIGQRESSTLDLSVGVFRFLMQNASALLNTFKIFLSSNVNFPEGAANDLPQEDKMGPPGKDVFMEAIRKDLGDEVDETALNWAAKMIFGLIVHKSVLLNTTAIKIKCDPSEEGLDPITMESWLEHSVKAHLDYLKKNPKFS